MSRGLIDAGFAHVVGVEVDADARATYENNIGDCLDVDLANPVKAANALRAYEIDVLAGGPPCTDFSSAGNRIEGERADLTACFGVIVQSIKPRVFVMENVVQSRESARYRFTVEGLRAVGYSIAAVELEGPHVGVPQTRKRLFTVGVLDGDVSRFAQIVHSKLASDPITLEQYGARIGYVFPPHFYVHPRGGKARRAIWSASDPAPTMRGMNRPIPAGYAAHARDTAPPTSARPLTTEERALVQTFPKGFTFIGNTTSQEKQIGNAVPPNMARFVGEAVLQLIDGPTTQQADMSASRRVTTDVVQTSLCEATAA